MAFPLPHPTDPLLQSVNAFVQNYMSHNDASHNFAHIQRVVGLSTHIYTHSPAAFRTHLNPRIITLAALLHDVGDSKYLRPGEDPETIVLHLLLSLGAAESLARYVQAICAGVSYSAEVRDPARAAALVGRYAELAVVQDADRLDSMGAIGLGRCFTFSGARMARGGLEEAMGLVESRLLRVGGMMKTEVGRKLARERCRRLVVFRDWWREEERFLGMAGGRLI